MTYLEALNESLIADGFKLEKQTFEVFSSELKSESNQSSKNLKKIKKYELARNLLNLFLFIYFIILIGLGFIFFIKNKETSAFVLSILILFTIPMIMFLQAINTYYFFLVSDICDSVNQAIYSSNLPIYGKGLGYIVNCHSPQVLSKGYSYNYELYKISESIDSYIELHKEEKESKAKIEKLEAQKKNILTVKKKYLDTILNCNSMYLNIIGIEDTLCRDGPRYSYNIFTNYFWLMISVLFVFWGFNRNVLVIKRRIYDVNEKLMAEEVDY